MKSHTPTPWQLRQKDLVILGPEKEDGWATVLAKVSLNNPDEETSAANAKLIIQAVNSLSLFKEALERIARYKEGDYVSGSEHEVPALRAVISVMRGIAKKALESGR